MTSTHDLAATTDALGTAFGTAGLALEPAAGLTDLAGTLTSVMFGNGTATTPATLAVITDAGLDVFDAAVAALQKSIPGLTPGEPTALGSVAELDTVRSGDVAFHTITTAEGEPVGLLILEQDRRRAESAPDSPTQPVEETGATTSPSTPTTDPLLAPSFGTDQVPGAGAPLSGAASNGAGGGSRTGLTMLSDVMLNVTVDLGRQSLALSQVLALSVGSVVELDRAAGAPVDIRVNGILFGRGEVVVVDDEYAVRIIEILETPDR